MKEEKAEQCRSKKSHKGRDRSSRKSGNAHLVSMRNNACSKMQLQLSFYSTMYFYTAVTLSHLLTSNIAQFGHV